MDELLMEALETFPNFVVIDDQERVIYLNRGYAALLGTTFEKAVGRPVTEIIPNTRLHLVLRSGKAEMGSVMTLFDHTVNGEIQVVCNRIPIRRNGKIVGAVAATTISDLLDVARLSEEIRAIRSENRRVKAELEQMKSALNPLNRVVGESPATRQLKESIADYADSHLTVLLTGETGVGKEVFARAVHQLSRRASGPYVKINCAAIPANLLESELFGYAEGAFSGAVKGGKPGKFQLADHGTLLLDEIGEMPMDLQAKLLRVLQEKEVERVGGTKPVKVDGRILCSTNQDLPKLVREGKFREDLYYRINVVELHILPLRERAGDIGPLCDYFIEKTNAEEGYAVTGMDPEVLALFQRYRWPGNVRELEHVVQRAAVRCRTGSIQLRHVDFLTDRAQVPEPAPAAAPAAAAPLNLRERAAQAERPHSAVPQAAEIRPYELNSVNGSGKPTAFRSRFALPGSSMRCGGNSTGVVAAQQQFCSHRPAKPGKIPEFRGFESWHALCLLVWAESKNPQQERSRST